MELLDLDQSIARYGDVAAGHDELDRPAGVRSGGREQSIQRVRVDTVVESFVEVERVDALSLRDGDDDSVAQWFGRRDDVVSKITCHYSNSLSLHTEGVSKPVVATLIATPAWRHYVCSPALLVVEDQLQ